jgi:hypothetical protein
MQTVATMTMTTLERCEQHQHKVITLLLLMLVQKPLYYIVE